MCRRPLSNIRCITLFSVVASQGLLAHNLDTRATSISLAKDYVQTMATRAGNNQPAVQLNDEFWVLVKTTPGPGTNTGVGGYQTFYIPQGSQVVGAAYVRPTTSDPRGFIEIPMKAQSPIAIGDGPIGAKAAVGLTGFTYPSANILGVNQAPVTAAGIARGTIAGVYADTGIFYSTDARTAFNSYGAAPTGGASPMTNNSGDTVGEWYSLSVPSPAILGVMTLWDSYQLRAFGRKDVTPIIDAADGRGNAPWGMASAVAGPQSGYKWSFNHAAYVSGGSNPAAIPGAVEVGPWNRIKYPGAQISSDQAGLISTTLGYTGVDASTVGYDFVASGPLPTTTTAVRFAIGQLELGRSEYSAVKVKITTLPSVQCYDIYADAFGGDAGGTDFGKDHIWRYFDPTVVSLDPCSLLQKVATNPLIAVGGTTSFDITYANLDDTVMPNVVLTDTLPAGLTYVSASPPPTSVSGNVLSWNFGNVPGQTVKKITLNVRGSATGVQLNTLSATSNGTNIGYAYETVEVASHSLLRKEKTVTPTTVAPNGTVTYTITVYNDGTAANGTPLTVTDNLPSGFTYQSFASATLNGAAVTPTITATDPTKPIFSVGQGILPGKTLVIRFVALVAAGTPSGVYWNGTDVSYEGKRLGPTPEAPVTVGGGRIGDFVWRDWNGNGVQDAGEEGISGISVQLWSDPNGDGNTADGVLLQTKTTGANGDYVFTGLGAGNYVVKIPTPPTGYLQTFDPQGVVDNAGKVTLIANQEFLTMDFGYKYDPANVNAASIGDFVYADNNRNGMPDPGEAGIPSVTVNLYEDTNGNGVVDTGDLLIRSLPSSDGTTDYDGDTVLDPEGFYLFDGLDPALKYVVDVMETDPDIDAFFGLPVTQTTPDRVAVSGMANGGTFDTADFGFFGLQPASIGDTVFLDTNANGTYDAGDFPISNVTVQLYLDDNGDGIAQAGELFSTTVTNSAGQYVFNNLGPDKYIVKVLSTDPDLPAGSIGTVPQYPVTLNAGDAITTADFPYVKNLTKTVDKVSAVAGDILTYTMRPYYPGSTLLSNAVITDPTPIGTTYNGGSSPTPFSAPSVGATGNVVWNLGSTVAASNGTGTTPGYTPTAIIRSTTAEVDDTYVNAANTATWYGGGTDLVTRPANASNVKSALMKFTLPTFATSDVVDRAVIRVMVKTPRTSNHTVTMRRLTTSWTEGTNSTTGASWNDSNGTGTAGDWTSAGVFGSSDYDGSVSYGSSSAPFVAGQTLEFDVTDLVRAWRAGTLSNEGVALIASGTDGGDLIFYSSENAGAATPGPRLVISYSSTGNGTTTVGDTFATVAYNNNTGSKLWAGGWIETGDGGSPSAGNILIGGGILQIKDTTTGISIYRSANLAGATAASLSLDMTSNTLDSTSDIIRLQASINGGSSWTTLDTYTKATATFTNKSFNLISLLGSVNKDTRIRFTVDTKGGKTGKIIKFDNVQISYTTPAAGTTSTQLSADTALLTGTRNVTVNMTVKADVSNNITPPATLTVTPTGTASATWVSGPTPATGRADSNGVTFTYVYQVVSGGGIGSVKFGGVPTTTSTSTYISGTSQSVLTTPPLVFQAKVNPVAPTPWANNTATLTDGNGLNVFAAAATATTASIGDLVWKDTNSDGLFDADGADNILGTADDEPGIAGVRVYLDSNNNGVYDVGEPNTFTDTSGTYRIYGLSAGNYTVRYDAATIPAGFVPSTATSQAVTLATAQQYNNADFGLSTSSSTPSSIGDTLWIDRNGDGIVDSGEPRLPNITVKLYYDANNNGAIDAGDLLLAATASDASGDYTFGGLSAGNYLVDVNEADPDMPAALVLASGGANGAGLQDVTLGIGVTYLTADFGYNYTGSLGDTVFYDPDQNGIQGGGEAGVPGVTIVLYNDVDSSGSVSASDTVVGTVITNASGQYLFSNLPPGNYVVKVDEQTVQSTPTSGVYGTMLGTTGSSKAVTLSPGAGMTNLNADFGFVEAAEIVGHVFYDINGNGVFDPGETPLQPVTVWVYGPGVDGILGNADDFADLRKTLVTDVGGEYTTLLPSGAYRVIYDQTDADAQPGVLTRVTTPVEYQVYLNAGQEISGLDFGRDNNGKIGDTIFADIDGTSGAGVGPGAGDARLPGVTVNLYLDTNGNGTIDADGADNIFGTADDEPLLDTQATDATGTYLFQGLANTTASQKYLVAVDTSTLPSSYLTVPTSYPTGAVTATSSYSTTLTGGAAINIVDFGYPAKPTTFTVSGNIWNDSGAGGGTAGDGTKNGTEPNFSGITVTITVDGTPYTVVTNASGNYSLSGVPGTAAVVITVDSSTLPSNAYGNTGDPDGVKNGTTSFTMANANKINQNFGYREVLASIAGTVVRNANGNGLADVGETAVSGVAVNLRYAGTDGILGTADDVLSSTSTNVSGGYNFTGLMPGLYEITKTNPTNFYGQADRDGGNPDNIQITIAAGNPVTGVADNKTGQDFEITNASLGDYVWYDVNGNGVQDSGEPPLSGVRVYVDANSNGSYDVGEANALTNALGAYTISNLPTGTTAVRVDTSTLPAGLAPSYDFDGIGSAYSANVTLAANQNRTDVDWGYQGNATVTGHLYVDTNGNHTQDPGEPDLVNVNVVITDALGVIRTVVTNASGNWSVVVPAGSTTANVDETDPDFTALVKPGYVQTDGSDPTTVTAVAGVSTNGGTDGYFVPGTITGFVLKDTNHLGVGDAPFAGVVLTLVNASGSPVDGDPNTSGVQPITTLSASDGSYTFANLPPGTYGVLETQPFGYDSVSDKDGGNLDEIRPLTVTGGLTNSGNNFVEALDTCPDDWAHWKFLHTGEVAAGNPDVDNYDNLVEFAFAQRYDSGAGNAWLIRPSTLAPGTIEGVFVRPLGAINNVTYTLQYAASPGNPTVWQSLVITPAMITAVPNGDCTETITIHGLEALTGLTGGKGVVRIKVALDETNDSVIDYISYTEVEGWQRTGLELCCRTFNNPFQRETLFAGTVSAVSGQTVTFATSAGTVDLATLLAPGNSYYLEVTAGDNEGQRFDVTSASGNSLTLANDNDLFANAAPYNTLSGAPPAATLPGDKIILHRHWTLAEVFPPGSYGATGDRTTADQVQLMANSVWIVYWLYNDGTLPPRWVKTGDNTYADQGTAVLAPGQGLFFNNQTAVRSILTYGEVRENNFIRPLSIGSNLVGGGYPLDQSATGRALTTANGFFGSRDIATADTFYLWNGDSTVGATGYTSYFLNNNAPRTPSVIKWAKVGDVTLTARDSEILLLGNRSALVRSKNGLNGYTATKPWTP